MANENMNIIGAGQDTARRAPKINTITCGDCLEVMRSIPDKSVDMILCDLPYGTTACKWDFVIDFEQLWNQYKRIIKIDTPIVLFSQQPFTTKLISSNFSMFKQELIWDKQVGGCFVHANRRILPRHENICLFYNQLPEYNPIMEEKEVGKIRPKSTKTTESNVIKMASGKTEEQCDRTKSFPTSILSFSRKMAECNESNRVHPTQKPVALFEYLIRTYTNEGDMVLDNCIGSGTTAIACINTGRDFIGIEKEKKYVDIANKRIKQAEKR